MNIKRKIEDLAIMGGKPSFEATLHVGRPNQGDRERFFSRVNDILDRNWLTNNGPYVQELEKKIADRLNVKNCVCMCNGTVALEIAARALGFTGEVIIPSLTFVATAHALQWQEITPVFCDVDPSSWTIDPGKIERLITPRTTGIIGVHLWGRPCDISGLMQIAKKHTLKVLFDASHAFGCSYQGKFIGGFGDVETFSFHATKFINTFEGGAILTNDDRLAEKIRLMQNFGFSGMDQVIYLGTNGKMSEIAAASGLTALEDLEKLIAINERNYHTYRQHLQNIPGVHLLAYDENERNNYQYIVINLDKNVAGISRDCLIKILHAENVRARRYFYPGCHRMEPYRSYYPNAGLLLSETEKIVDRVLCLPTGMALETDDIVQICDVIRTAIKYNVEMCTFFTQNVPSKEIPRDS